MTPHDSHRIPERRDERRNERSHYASDAKPGPGFITSADLLADGKLVHIQHRGELYLLRETRLGKLILTK